MDQLHAGQQLNMGDQLVSNNGRVNLVMQSDGNLVLYRTLYGRPLWCSNTGGPKPVTYAAMQGDGNFVAYSAGGTAYWSTGTYGHPGAWLILQDDGNLVVYDSAGSPLWASNTVQDWTSPTFRYLDSRGYLFDETSESWQQLCQSLPSFAGLQWPDYTTEVFEDVINGQPVVIQCWKGWCPRFLGIGAMPGGIGAEVGVYQRVPGHVRPQSIPFLPPDLAKPFLDALATLTDDELWWPIPKLGAQIQFTLTNPVNNQVFFSAGPETSYWLSKWMDEGSYYMRYQPDQGTKWWWLPPWWPGNSNVPLLASDFLLDWSVSGSSSSWHAPVRVPPPAQPPIVNSSRKDYDGDRRTDLAVWRPSEGNWWIINSSTGGQRVQQWGTAGDIPVPGDYDGDGHTDLAVWRPSTGTWWIIDSSTGGQQVQQWGTAGDIPVPGDYDGDGRTDLAVWRPSTGTWWIINSSTGGQRVQQWGTAGDIPVPADYDGDGRTDLAVWRPSTGTWWIIDSSTGSQRVQQWGTAGDIPVPADYDGDGRTDVAVWRPTEGNWWIVNSSTDSQRVQQWGTAGDIPVPGDYDGDGRADPTVWRPSDGNWWIITSSNAAQRTQQWGTAGDVPV